MIVWRNDGGGLDFWILGAPLAEGPRMTRAMRNLWSNVI